MWANPVKHRPLAKFPHFADITQLTTAPVAKQADAADLKSLSDSMGKTKHANLESNVNALNQRV
jgi:hypothetical protein